MSTTAPNIADIPSQENAERLTTFSKAAIEAANKATLHNVNIGREMAPVPTQSPSASHAAKQDTSVTFPSPSVAKAAAEKATKDLTAEKGQDNGRLLS